MPPYIKRNCPHCHTSNTYDLLELQQDTTAVVFRSVDLDSKEYVAKCDACRQEFVVIVNKDEPGGSSRGGD